MKLPKLILAGLLVCSFAAAASAQTEIYIVGSTAYRASVTKSIQDVLTTGYTYAWDGGSGGKNLYGGGAALFKGTISNTQPSGGGASVIVHTFWTGSLAGLLDTSGTTTISGFIPDATATSVSGTNVHSGYTAEKDLPNVTMSDCLSASGAKSIALAPGNGSTYAKQITNAAFQDAGATAGPKHTVGIVPFVWVAGAQTTGSAPYGNITQQQALELIQKGNLPAVSLTGTSPDTDYVFLVGRNEDSGTRIGALAEAQNGFGQNALQVQLQFANSSQSQSGGLATGGTGSSVTDFGLWPASSPVNTEPTINYNSEGHSGYIAGGDVGNVLASLNPLTLNGTAVDGGDVQPDNYVSGTSRAYFVGYLSEADAAGINTLGTIRTLTYNGVPYTPSAILNGTYTFWTLEHMYYRTGAGVANAVTGTSKNFADDLADKLFAADAQTNASTGVVDTNSPPTDPKVTGILFNANVGFTRTVEGGSLSQTF